MEGRDSISKLLVYTVYMFIMFPGLFFLTDTGFLQFVIWRQWIDCSFKIGIKHWLYYYLHRENMVIFLA